MQLLIDKSVRRRDTLFQCAPLLLENRGDRALERVDRLFVVAHREECARALPRALARPEIRGDRVQNVPLRRGGVLRLVDQHVVDARIELIEHPGGAGAAQQLPRAGDEILVVQQAARGLHRRIMRGDALRQGEERLRARGAERGAPFFKQRRDALLLGVEQGAQRRVLFIQRVGDELPLFIAPEIAVGLEENSAVGVERLAGFRRGDGAAQIRRQILIS